MKEPTASSNPYGNRYHPCFLSILCKPESLYWETTKHPWYHLIFPNPLMSCRFSYEYANVVPLTSQRLTFYILETKREKVRSKPQNDFSFDRTVH